MSLEVRPARMIINLVEAMHCRGWAARFTFPSMTAMLSSR